MLIRYLFLAYRVLAVWGINALTNEEKARLEQSKIKEEIYNIRQEMRHKASVIENAYNQRIQHLPETELKPKLSAQLNTERLIQIHASNYKYEVCIADLDFKFSMAMPPPIDPAIRLQFNEKRLLTIVTSDKKRFAQDFIVSEQLASLILELDSFIPGPPPYSPSLTH